MCVCVCAVPDCAEFAVQFAMAFCWDCALRMTRV